MQSLEQTLLYSDIQDLDKQIESLKTQRSSLFDKLNQITKCKYDNGSVNFSPCYVKYRFRYGQYCTNCDKKVKSNFDDDYYEDF